MRIEVTEDDIREGHRLDCYECPVALAISRVVGAEVRVEKGGWVTTEDDACADLPEDVFYRVEGYDEGDDLEPFGFDLPELAVWARPYRPGRES